jgi:hypothetical protein
MMIRSPFVRTWLIWTAGFLAFPLAGLAGTAVAGRVDSPLAALTGGAVAGLVIGTAQALLSRGRLDPRRWIPATTIAMPVLWSLGWTVTTLAGINVDEQFTNVGVSGALTISALSGLLLHQLLPYRAAAGRLPAQIPVEGSA